MFSHINILRLLLRPHQLMDSHLRCPHTVLYSEHSVPRDLHKLSQQCQFVLPLGMTFGLSLGFLVKNYDVIKASCMGPSINSQESALQGTEDVQEAPGRFPSST
jgi:hypothetical protein